MEQWKSKFMTQIDIGHGGCKMEQWKSKFMTRIVNDVKDIQQSEKVGYGGQYNVDIDYFLASGCKKWA